MPDVFLNEAQKKALMAMPIAHGVGGAVPHGIRPATLDSLVRLGLIQRTREGMTVKWTRTPAGDALFPQERSP